MKKHRVLFVISALMAGGAENALINLLHQLNRDCYDIDLIIIQQKSPHEPDTLVHRIPPHVHVCCGNKHISILARCRGKLLYTANHKQHASIRMLDFVCGKEYDMAVQVGEWFSPAFVAEEVCAKKKMAWIHTDLLKSVNFNAEEYFSYFEHYDKFLFVSQNACEKSCKAFPFIAEKAGILRNPCDANRVRKLSEESVSWLSWKRPMIVTVANIRAEKGHMRQLEAMRILRERGTVFTWINIGAFIDEQLVSELSALTKIYGLQDRYLLLGEKENPYPYIRNADAVAVLSDYESWSMVITEAKILGVPVIATKTSGALEQIAHEVNGILCGFNSEEIADKIEQLIIDSALQKTIRKNIAYSDITDEVLQSFDQLVESAPSRSMNDKNQLLYVIDDINYNGGAHIATCLQIQKLLKSGKPVSVFSESIPSVALRTQLLGAQFLSWMNVENNALFNRRLLDCCLDRRLTRRQILLKLKMSLFGKLIRKRNGKNAFEAFVFEKTSDVFSSFDTVCVISEASVFVNPVAASTARRKVHWIHTDYIQWEGESDYTRTMSNRNKKAWEKFDAIVVLCEKFKNDLVAAYPKLHGKLYVARNLLPVNAVIRGAESMQEKWMRFVSISRISKEKAYDRLIRVLSRLRDEGYHFIWTIVGDGELFQDVKNMVILNELQQYVVLVGWQANPYMFLAQADVLGLLSYREGLPQVIYEAFLLGKPVLATSTGGIETQIRAGENGWITENNEEAIYQTLKYILMHSDDVEILQTKLSNYTYNNTEVFETAVNCLY